MDSAMDRAMEGRDRCRRAEAGTARAAESDRPAETVMVMVQLSVEAEALQDSG